MVATLWLRVNSESHCLSVGHVREVYHEKDVRIIEGDSRRALAAIPDSVFQCCVTSPPYWGLRDYGIDGQIGAENDPDSYIADLVGIFREVRRTLREDGTLWLNIGDSYTSGDRRWRAPDKKNPGRAMSYELNPDYVKMALDRIGHAAPTLPL